MLQSARLRFQKSGAWEVKNIEVHADEGLSAFYGNRHVPELNNMKVSYSQYETDVFPGRIITNHDAIGSHSLLWLKLLAAPKNKQHRDAGMS